MNKPFFIEKRIFTCTSCGYKVQVNGEQYFDYGCRNYIITFQCLECKELFEGIVTEMKCWRPPVVEHDLADEIICLRCGTDKNRVWNKESGLCPKCNSKMAYEAVGVIKVDYHDKNKSE
jgi:DNA-directed RNA polymerase subunit RPC12/RpoP